VNIFSLREALQRRPDPGRLSVELGQLGDAELEFYAPATVDAQKPHARDEFYIVARGSGTFQIEDRSFAFETGDVIFGPAGIEHRFKDFSDDFAAWEIFIGGHV
jgi:mannose-6-phosphate isomerase-like protein (cupin superfamily)